MTNDHSNKSNVNTDNHDIEDVFKFIVSCSDTELAVLTVKRVADHFAINRYRLARKLRAEHGITPEKYIHLQKMTRAAGYLSDKDEEMSAHEIAIRLGYCSYQYFSQRFKEFFGLPPGLYRRCRRESQSTSSNPG